MQLIHVDDMQEPDVLESVQGKLQDVTALTEDVVQLKVGTPETVVIVWDYAYHRIPITAYTWQPELLSRDSKVEPPPTVSNFAPVRDDVTGKNVGCTFTIRSDAIGAWQCNVQVACTYFNEQMGREYTHRRTLSFTASTQPPLDTMLEKVREQYDK